ncbi:WecB/TagA/CpsF family glycosyltransferase [Methyloligella sp. 2.7D]|uniref:WecB/TagA/CpsF family glycosyltransferase n=1 Tax=unclassified Methyloligella TaxID=2625955 RepID=UPI00157C8E02|nr:WecB/TagA/CpsF family glycosyltransferase [Methyloligella sp. GL2]QKP78198.1 WecB/TagA/CpsF family glycosyltransferase [Methyloligella sp. GL2]
MTAKVSPSGGEIAKPGDTDMAVVDLLGFDVTATTADRFAELLLQRARSGQGGHAVTLNMEHLGRAARDPVYGGMIRSAEMICADGAPVHWACRMTSGSRIAQERIAGVDLVETLLQRGEGVSFGIIGGVDPKLALAKYGVSEDRIAYLNSDIIPTDPEGLSRVAKDVAAAGPQLVFIALGVPKQDIVGQAVLAELPSAVVIGIGGSFEMLGGLKRRAPRLIQKLGLEWAFRFAQEPRRLFARYCLLYPAAVWRLLLWTVFKRGASSGDATAC